MSAATEVETAETEAAETVEMKANAKQDAKAADETENKSDNISCCGSCSG